MKCALSIAGSDSVGGAGIQADIKAMSSLDVHCCTAITAVTAQNTTSVVDILPMSEEMVQTQIEAVLKDVDVKAIKTGMLYSPEIVGVVADILDDHEMPLVIDPVMVATVGDSLATRDLSKAIMRKLIPICELITPNLREAEILADMDIVTEYDVRYACEVIGKEASSVLLKGGHMSGSTVTDYLYLSSEVTRLEYPRLEKAGHGSGCTLSAFITANMAKGMDIVNSVINSRKLIQTSIQEQYAIGNGEKIVNPVIRSRDDRENYTILDEVDAAAEHLVDIIYEELVPGGGMNIAYAKRNAAGPEDIAAMDKRLTFHNGSLRKNGKPRFGSAEQMSYVLLSAMRFNPKMRCNLNLEYSKELVELMEEVGLSIEHMDRKNNKKLLTGELVTATLKKTGYVPDVLVDKDKNKNEKLIRILAENPGDLLDKLELFL